VHLVGFRIRIYHDARSPERQFFFKIFFVCFLVLCVFLFCVFCGFVLFCIFCLLLHTAVVSYCFTKFMCLYIFLHRAL